MRGRQAAAEDGEVLAEGEHQATVHETLADDHAITGNAVVGHAEIVAIVLDEHVPLLERVFVEEQFEAFARGQLALRVLLLDAMRTAAEARRIALLLEPFDDVFHAPSRAPGRARCRCRRCGLSGHRPARPDE